MQQCLNLANPLLQGYHTWQHLLLHIDKQFAGLKQSFNDAFPNGDPHGHRIAHEKAIADATQWHKVRQGVVEKVASGAVWAAILFAALAVWDAIKREAGKCLDS